MSQIIYEYIDSLPKERISRNNLTDILRNKINGFRLSEMINLRGSLDIFKITDTLFYTESQGESYIFQNFTETAYENMIVTFNLIFSPMGYLTNTTINIYKLIDGDTWDIYMSKNYRNEILVEFTIVAQGPDYPIENLIRSQGGIGEYVRLGGDHRDLVSFFKRLVALSPIILPEPILDFEGKIEEAFICPLRNIVGIQFIDIEPEII